MVIAAKQKQSNAELKHGTIRTVAFTEAAATILATAIKWGVIGFLGYEFTEGLKALSGKTTLADIAVKVAGTVAVNKWVAYVLAGGALTWGYGERRLRRKKTAELSDRIIVLEKGIDKGRSSSMLTPRGTTKDGD
jgi:uncharacterized membrane protein YuzA (DUF378 family)